MKTSDQDMAKRGAKNTRQEQENVVSRDSVEQTRAGARESLEKARKQKEKKEKKKSDD